MNGDEGATTKARLAYIAMNWISLGVERGLRGLRTGDQRLVFTGAALLIIGWLRRGPKEKKKVLYRRELKPGKALLIRSPEPGSPRFKRTDQIL